MDFAHLATALGLGAGIGAIVFAACLRLAQGALVEAVRRAGERELEGLRQNGAADLERMRQSAARDLEGFKADLALAAEMRRQVAAARVTALTRLSHGSRAVLNAIFDRSAGDLSAQIDAAIDATNTLHRVMIEAEHLLSKECAGRIYEAMKALGDARTAWFSDITSRNEMERGDRAYDRAHAAHYRLINIIREELDSRAESELGDRAQHVIGEAA